MWFKKIINIFQKEAYEIPIYVCLFLVPLFFNPFFVHSFIQGKELAFKFIILITALVIAAMMFFKKNWQLREVYKSPLFLLLFFIFFFGLLSAAISPTPTVALHGTYSRGFGVMIQFFLFSFLLFCAFRFDEKKIRKALFLSFLSGLFVSFYAVLQKSGFEIFFNNFDKDIFVGRVFSFLGNPGYLGQFMTLEIIIAAYFLTTSKSRKNQIFYGIGALLFLMTLWFSQTRTALLALILCFILGILHYRKFFINAIKKLSLLKKITFLATTIVLIGGIFLTLPQEKFSFSGTALRSLHSRFEIWKGAIQLIQKRPFLGYGQETFYIYAPEIITKKFLTLEEDVGLSVDRIHNEFLEIIFSSGLFAGLLYIILFIFLLRNFFKSQEKITMILSLIVIANMLQNQFSFSDITISILMAFCLGSLVAIQVKNREFHSTLRYRYAIAIITLIFISSIFYTTVYKLWRSQLAYAHSKENYSASYDIAVEEHKKALSYTPYYSEPWYELMALDPSSMPRALHYLEQIENNSGNVLAWKGNYYSTIDPAKASQAYLAALEKNPYYPNWIRSYADMLYKNGDFKNALYLYQRYLDFVPDFWKWKDKLDQLSEKERTSFRIFLKNVPDFWNTVERVKTIENALMAKS